MAAVTPGVNFHAVGSLSGDSNGGEPEIQKVIPLEDLLALRRVYRGSPLLEQIRGILQKSVWSAGMGFFRENLDKGDGQFTKNRHRKVYNPPSFVRETIESHLWVKFMHDVLDSLLMYGFVVVHYQTPKQAGEAVVDELQNKYPFPSVVPAELFRVVISTSLAGGTKLVALHTRHQEPIPDTVVYYNYGYNPTCDGQLNSLVAKAYPNIRFLQSHAATFMRIRGIRCHPTAVIESSAEVTDEASGSLSAGRRAFNMDLSETVGINPADNLLAQSVHEGQMPHALMVDPNQISQQDDLAYRRARKNNAMRRGDLNAASMVDVGDDGIGAPRRVGVAHGVPLRRGETVRFMPTPSETNDFQTTRRVVMENVAGVFGVPLGVLMGNAQSGHGRGTAGENNSRVVHSMYRLTVNEWRGRVADVMTKAFGECYWELMAGDKSAGGTAENTSKVDVHAEKRRRMVHVDFHPTTFIDNQELRELYEWGVLPWETFSTYALSNASLPADERNANPPKHPLGLGYDLEASEAKKPKEKNKPKPKAKPGAGKGGKQGGSSGAKSASGTNKRKASDASGEQNIVITVKKAK